jgi:tRNA(Arg) A34 adenosine deaminase TadA
MQDDFIYMRSAMEEAIAAGERGEVPIGAVLVDRRTGKIAARAGNRTRELNDPSAHAELLAIRDVCAIEQAQRIPDYDLYVTLEPCTLCAAAIAYARIPRLVYGARDTKGGAVDSGVTFFAQPTCHHKIVVESGVLAEESADLLKQFFRQRR